MIKFCYIFLLVFINKILIAQCNVQVTERPDGTIVRYLSPKLVGSKDDCELGISIQTNGEIYTINTLVRYKSKKALKQLGSLKIKLKNNISIEPKLFATELASLKGEEVSVGVYTLTKDDVKKLKESELLIVIFKDIKGINNIIIVNQNYNIAINQINCLE